MRSKIFLGLAIASLAVGGYAKTVTVNSAGGADFTTINAALADVRTAVDGPDIINITGGGPYTEAAGIRIADESLTIQGVGTTATIVVGKTVSGPSTTTDDRGIAIYNTPAATAEMTATLGNLIVIPDAANPPLRGIYSNNNATGLGTQRMHVVMNNVHVTGNDGSNAAIALDHTTSPTLGGSNVYYRDDAVFFAGFVDLNATGLYVVNLGLSANSPDGLVFNSDDASTCVVNGPADFSYNGRCGVQLASDGGHYEFNGTAANPIWVANNNQTDTGGAGFAVWHDNSNANGGGAVYSDIYSYLIIANSGLSPSNLADSMSFLFVDAGNGNIINADHIAIVNGSASGFSGGGDMRDSSFTNCTVVNCLASPISMWATAPTDTGTATFSNCVIAGNGTPTTADANNKVYSDDPGLQILLQDSALVLNGPYRLADSGIFMGTTAGAKVPQTLGGTNGDPQFVGIDPAFSTFVDVASSAYGIAGPAGGPLHGFGDYVGTPAQPPTAAHDWQMFE